MGSKLKATFQSLPDKNGGSEDNDTKDINEGCLFDFICILFVCFSVVCLFVDVTVCKRLVLVLYSCLLYRIMVFVCGLMLFFVKQELCLILSRLFLSK